MQQVYEHFAPDLEHSELIHRASRELMVLFLPPHIAAPKTYFRLQLTNGDTKDCHNQSTSWLLKNDVARIDSTHATGPSQMNQTILSDFLCLVQEILVSALTDQQEHS